MRRLLVVLALIPALLATTPLAHASLAGVFTSPAGAAVAEVALDVCAGGMTLTVALTPLAPGGPSGTRTVTVTQQRVPNGCIMDCQCPTAWAFILTGPDVRLVGEAARPGAFTLQGAFQEGALEATGTLR